MDWLKARGVTLDVRDITKSEQDLDDLVNRWRSRGTPTVVFGRKPVVGFQPERYEEFLALTAGEKG